MNRINVTDLDNILGHSFKVLDDGFVRVIDYMGSDSSIVQAARVSYGKGTKKLNEDVGLIRYLMRNRHTSPFEMCEIKLHVRVPMDCWRQWIRHRTASVNEYSTRYSIAIDSVRKTQSNEWRKQSLSKKQGSGEFIDVETGETLTNKEQILHQKIKEVYDERIKLDVAREQARKDLSLSTYTEAYWKIDLHNLFHFLLLRMDENAQSEIRSYANTIGYNIVKKWCPISWEAFLDYRINSILLSDAERKVIQILINNEPFVAKEYLLSKGLLSLSEGDGSIKRSREAVELDKKILKFGLEVDWEKI